MEESKTVADLEARLQSAEQENATLRTRITLLEQENAVMRAKLLKSNNDNGDDDSGKKKRRRFFFDSPFNFIAIGKDRLYRCERFGWVGMCKCHASSIHLC
mmetsp:Transcript_7324/g.10932  ORF Transcript_7324/g.10932 Transcript_7324/m.10932 type:complete len:101 (+) Transcript_7324:110-412(+)